MTCDDVFQILTRGPFPSGSPDDAAVEAHLYRCADCRRLAEALRPIDDSLRESAGVSEGDALPGYRGDALSAASDLAVSLSPRARRAPVARIASLQVRLRANGHLNVWEFAGAIALGIVVAVTLRTLLSSPADSARSADLGSPDTSRLTGADHSRVVLIGLPEACRQIASGEIAPGGLDEPSPLLFQTTSRIERCCTECHHAGSKNPTSALAMHQSQLSCSACHD